MENAKIRWLHIIEVDFRIQMSHVSTVQVDERFVCFKMLSGVEINVEQVSQAPDNTGPHIVDFDDDEKRGYIYIYVKNLAQFKADLKALFNT